jgi:hypothetical protein
VAKSVIYKCAARHYKNDQEHYWEIVDGVERRHWPKTRGRALKSAIPKTCSEHAPPVAVTAADLVAGINVPGMVGTQETEKWPGQPDMPVFVLTGNGITIRVNFWGGDIKKPVSASNVLASGHVSFTTSKGERTFDRTGVEDSFYVYWRGVPAVQAEIEKQITKVAESRTRIDGMVSIPGIPFLINPAEIENTAALIRGNGKRFLPSGFGTGYYLYSRSKPASRYDGRATVNTEKFFGVSPIWIRHEDCD